MFEVLYDIISRDKQLQKDIRRYLENQDIFNVSMHFNNYDIYNLCQLANYLLYLKIIFYSYPQRDVPKLGLKRIYIPDDYVLLNKTLKARFEDVLKHDFDLIFKLSVLDDFIFPNNYIQTLRKNIDEIYNLNFKEINVDIIGSIYNTLIDNQEQHDRGQHFTNTNEVDIICGFCIDERTNFILDSGCGAGTFLVRAYYFLKYYNPKYTHQELLERLWGIDIAAFPAFLATMNLSLQDITCEENYPTIIKNDFLNVKSNARFRLISLDVTHELEVQKLDGKQRDVKMPVFDTCIGNPPYIRQESIHKKEEWTKLINHELNIKKINQQSDLYVYYLMHTTAFLKEGGRLGYVISSSWLDVNFGAGLQKFLLDNFKLIAIIDNQAARSFATASINTVILIIEKCSDSNERDNNNVKFVRVNKAYKDIIGKFDDDGRILKVQRFVNGILNTKENSKKRNYSVLFKKQSELRDESTIDGKYQNGHWGAKYFRATAIFNRIMTKKDGKLIKLSDVCDIWRGFTTGVNDFFYLNDDTEIFKRMTDEETLNWLGSKIQNKSKFFEK